MASKDEQLVESVRVKGASALVLLFAKETKLQQGSTLSVYSNENCTDLVKSYEAKSDNPSLSPLTVPFPDAWIQIPRPKDIPCNGQIRVIPVHSSLGLACWIIDFMLDAGIQWASALASNGGMSALCYEFCQMILENYNLEKLAPSPLKEALLRLISKMLTKINEIRGERDAAASSADLPPLGGAESKSPPRIIRQVSAFKSASQGSSLATLKNLNGEMMDLFKAESSDEVYTSYLQQLVDLMAVTDNLRPTEQKLCSKFEFKLPLSEEEKKRIEEEEAKKEAEEQETEWSCAMCTMLNPMDVTSCDVCGSPKPKPQPKAKKKSGGATGGVDVGQQMFHDVMALVATMRYLSGRGQVQDSPAVRALMESAQKEVSTEKMQERLFVIENVPSGEPELVKRALQRVLRQASDTVRIDHIYLGVDTDKPELKALAPREQPKKAGKTAFAWQYNFDKNGIVYHLSTNGNTSSWRNAHEANTVRVTSSTHDTGSNPLSMLVGLDTCRVTSKAQKGQWFAFEFPGYSIIPRRYTLRNADTSRTEGLRSWRFEGSNDGKKWTTITEHKRDNNLTQRNAMYTWSVPADHHEAYSSFRIFMTGKNHSSNDMLVLGGFELYGRLFRMSAKAPAVSTPNFAVVEVMNSDAKVLKALVDGVIGQELPLYIEEEKKKPAPTPPTTDEVKKDDTKSADDAKTAAAASTDQKAPTATAAAVPATETAAKKADDDKAATAPATTTTATTATPAAAAAGDTKKDDEKKSDATSATPAASTTSTTTAATPASEKKEDKKEDKKEEDSKKEDAKKEESKKEEAPKSTPTKVEKVSSKPTKTKASKSGDGSDTKNASQHPPNEDEAKETELDPSILQHTSGPRHVSLGVQRLKDVGVSISIPYYRSLLINDAAEVKERQDRLERERKLFSRHVTPAATAAAPASTDPSVSPPPPSPLPPTSPSATTHKGTATARFASAVREIFGRHVEGKEARLPQAEFSSMFGYGDSGLGDELMAVALTSPDAYPQVDGGYSVDTLIALLVSHIVLNSSINTVMEWLEAAGYDRAIELNHYVDTEEAMESQSRDTWTYGRDVALMALLQQLGDRCGENNLLKVGSTQLRPREDDLRAYAALEGISLPSLRLRFTFFKKFNSLFASALPLIDLKRTDDSESIAGLVRTCRLFVFSGVKVEFFQKMLDLTAEPCKPPQVTLNRVKLQSMVDTGEAVDFVRDTLFGRAFQQLRTMDPFKLRPVRPQGAEPFMAFEVVIKGEHVVGEGGPYRQFFTDVGHELQNAVYNCPLFTPSPNQVARAGENRDRYMIRPSSTSTQMIHMYEFVGLLFGSCIRTGVRFPLDLPAFVWKPLVNDTLSRYELEQVDKHAADVLKYIESIDEKDFDSAIVETFTTRLSDKSTVELKDNGANIKVTYENRKEYIHLVLAARLSEHKQQIDAIRRGMALSIPIQLLNLLTWQDLETLVCGRSFIDIDLLRRHTKYSDSVRADAAHIEWFWQILHSFDAVNRRLFIRFAWAQDRLPADDAEFERSRTRMMIKPTTHSDPDKALPHSDTCFFNLALPAYTNEETMRKKLLYAISSTMTMNADDEVEDIHGTRQPRGGRRHDDDE